MGSPSSFPQTPWTILQEVRDAAGEEARNAAINHLCRHYWYPLYAFARRKGLGHQDAQDQTQAFLAHLIQRGSFSQADPGRGRFRSFLLGAFQNHLIKKWEHDNAQRRGGGAGLTALDMAHAEERFRQEGSPGPDPAVSFDRAWALAVVDACLEEMAEAYRGKGVASEFSVLRPFLNPASVSDAGIAEAARQLGLSEAAMRQRVSRARMRFAKILRSHVAGSLADPTPEAVQEEMRFLRDTLGHS